MAASAASGDNIAHHDMEHEQVAPTLSVVVLNYNYGRYLSECLDSILRQTWTNFEVILINDCSTDDSLDVIEPYLAEHRVRFVNHAQNKGFITSLIEGAQLSRGRYYMHMSADDFCTSDQAFETLLQVMEADAEVAFAYSAYGICGDDRIMTWFSRPLDHSCTRSGAEEYRDLLLHNNHVLHSGTIIRKSAYTAVGGWDPAVRYTCDLTMWLMLCGQGKVAYCADDLYAYRKHGSNMSSSMREFPRGIPEDIYGVEKSFPSMRGSPGISDDLYVSGIKQALTIRSMMAAFSGQPLLAWYAYWCGFRIHPMLTVFQNRTLVLLGRTLLGQRGYDALRTALRRDWWHRKVLATAKVM